MNRFLQLSDTYQSIYNRTPNKSESKPEEQSSPVSLDEEIVDDIYNQTIMEMFGERKEEVVDEEPEEIIEETENDSIKDKFVNRLHNLYESDVKISSGGPKKRAKKYKDSTTPGQLVEGYGGVFTEYMKKKIRKQIEEELGIRESKPSVISESITPEETKEKPQETLSEDVITDIQDMTQPQKSYIDEMSEQLGRFVKKQENNSLQTKPPSNELNEDEVFDPKYRKLEMQIKQLREMVMEAQTHNAQTLVSAIGSGGVGTSPGSGEVWIANMDDFKIGAGGPGISQLGPQGAAGAQGGRIPFQVGDTLVWNGERFLPSSAGAQGAQTKPPTAVTVAMAPPAAPVDGDLWWNTTVGVLYIWYGTSWVDTNSGILLNTP